MKRLIGDIFRKPVIPSLRRFFIFFVLTTPGILAGPQSSREHVLAQRLSLAAVERTNHRVTYDGRYRSIEYPGGDVPDHIGVCTDLVIRSYRNLGIDLQRLVHEDMKKEFAAYPKIWGLRKPDSNIDHRRVPNLQVFLKRHGAGLPISSGADDYRMGDLVTWMLPGNLPHIGIVTHLRSGNGRHPLIAHNIGNGPELEDILFRYEITGHYRYLPVRE